MAPWLESPLSKGFVGLGRLRSFDGSGGAECELAEGDVWLPSMLSGMVVLLRTAGTASMVCRRQPCPVGIAESVQTGPN